MEWAGNCDPARDENEDLINLVLVLWRSLAPNLALKLAGNRDPACDGYEDYRI